MRKSLLTLFTIVVIGILAGCSIPIGDGLLTVSSDGIDFISSDDNDLELEDDSAVPVNTPSEDDDAEGDSEDDNANEVTGNDDEEMEENNQGQQGDSNSGMCADVQDHSALVNNIGEPFYFPECAVIKSQSLSAENTETDLEIANSNWQDIADEYREALSNYNVTEKSDFDSESIEFRFKLDEELLYTSSVQIYQTEDSVYLAVRIYNE